MGRRKITIRQITDPKLKHITFNKRKNGLIKKACELSLLCNVNMLLIFEDGAGNLVQFSRNRISGIQSFFQECKYNNIIELTSKEYPNFFKVNHYKKTKHAGKSSPDDINDGEIDQTTSQVEYQLPSIDIKPIQPKPLVKDLKPKDALKKTNTLHQMNPMNPMAIQQLKAEMSASEGDRAALVNDSRIVQENSDLYKKKQGKTNTHIPLNNSEDNARMQKTPPNENPFKNLPISDMNEAIQNPYGNYKKDPYQDDQSKNMNDKPMDFNAPQFMQPAIDPLKRLSGVPEAMPSPFNFYPANNRLRGFGNFGLAPFTNEDALNTMLKSYPSFAFQMSGNPAFMGKPQTGGEIDEKILDTAKMQNYLSQAGAILNRHHNIFNFPTGEFSKINPNEAMRQQGVRNEAEYHNNFTDEQHEDFPVMFKGDHRFESGPIPANMQSRRFTSDAYFSNFEDEFTDKKKFKHN